MRYLKRKNYDGTIRKVVSDDGTKFWGIVGTVGDLLKEDLMLFADCSGSMWAFIKPYHLSYKVWFGYSRSEVVDNAIVYDLPCARSC